MYDLKGKVALVTGSGGKRGIGRAIVKRLASHGAYLVVNDVENQSRGQDGWDGVNSVVGEVQEIGGQAMGVIADVSDAVEVEEMVNRVVDRFGRLDILINNAGSRPGRDRVPVVHLEENAWDSVYSVNVKGVFLCSRAAARRMIDQNEGGKIVNISSSRGKQGAALYAAYASSKFAVIGFTQSLALELAPHQINVNAVCPGMVDTDRIGLIAAALKQEGESTDKYHERMIREREAQVPLGRIAAAEDVAKTVAFLASSESDYLTGLSISVTGGTHMS